MIRQLRKGTTFIELSYRHGLETVSAKNTEVELMPDHAVFRTTIDPVDANTRDDADNVLKENISSFNMITFRDKKIRDAAAKFLKAYEEKINHIKFELLYDKKYIFTVSLKPLGTDGLEFTINQ